MCFLWNSFLCMINLFMLWCPLMQLRRITSESWSTSGKHNAMFTTSCFISLLCLWVIWGYMPNTGPLPSRRTLWPSPPSIASRKLNFIYWISQTPLPSGFWVVSGHCEAQRVDLKGESEVGHWLPPLAARGGGYLYGRPYLLWVILFWNYSHLHNRGLPCFFSLETDTTPCCDGFDHTPNFIHVPNPIYGSINCPHIKFSRINSLKYVIILLQGPWLMQDIFSNGCIFKLFLLLPNDSLRNVIYLLCLPKRFIPTDIDLLIEK